VSTAVSILPKREGIACFCLFGELAGVPTLVGEFGFVVVDSRAFVLFDLWI
jgi:hypothetical protein